VPELPYLYPLRTKNPIGCEMPVGLIQAAIHHHPTFGKPIANPGLYDTHETQTNSLTEHGHGVSVAAAHHLLADKLSY